MSLGVADGVGAWVESGIDPSLFSQALCYHAHRYSKTAWAGEPETEPGEPYDDPVEGWELTPQECIELSHGGVLRERTVQAGQLYHNRSDLQLNFKGAFRFKYDLCPEPERPNGYFAGSKVRCVCTVMLIPSHVCA